MVRDAVHKRRFCVLEAVDCVERVSAWRGELQQELEDRVRVHHGRGGSARPTSLRVDVLQHPAGGNERARGSTGTAGAGEYGLVASTYVGARIRTDHLSGALPTLLVVRSTRDAHRVVLKCLADANASARHRFRVIYVGPTIEACKRRVARDVRVHAKLRHVRPEVRAKRRRGSRSGALG